MNEDEKFGNQGWVRGMKNSERVIQVLIDLVEADPEMKMNELDPNMFSFCDQEKIMDEALLNGKSDGVGKMNDEKLAGTNINKTILEILHSELERLSDNSIYKSVCPVCKRGILLIYRDQETLELKEYDRCILCGQQIRYLDIELLRKREGGKNG